MRLACRQGRDAAINVWKDNLNKVINPYRKGTKSALYWQWGYEQAERAIKTLMEIGYDPLSTKHSQSKTD